jgi:hypothetical protein
MTVGFDRGLEKGDTTGNGCLGRVRTAAAAGTRIDLACLGTGVR